MTVPAHGAPRMFGAPRDPRNWPDPYGQQHSYPGTQDGYPGAPIAPAPTAHRDFEEVTADEYAQRAAGPVVHQPQPAMRPEPVERPRDPAGQHLGDLRAEVSVEQAVERGDPEYPDGAIPVLLTGPNGRRGVIHVLQPDDWPSDANSAMHVGDYESWADGCLAGDDYQKVWRDVCPRLRDIGEMMARFRAATGQDQGKSLSSPRSLRNAARR